MGDIRDQFKTRIDELFNAIANNNGTAPKVAVATHDDILIQYALKKAQELSLAKQDYEMQFLYGMRRHLAEELAAKGHFVRVYVPYGAQWFPYFYRRLRERKENVFFVLRNLFRS